MADYLDQHGRTTRTDQIPPIGFWEAAAAHAHPSDLYQLGDAAWDRGLYRDATQLHKNATTHGNAVAAHNLVRHMHALHPADHRPAAHAAAHTALDNPYDVARLLGALRQAEAGDQVTALADRLPAAGMFDQFLQVDDDRMERLRFGREPVGYTADRWRWEDLLDLE